MALMPVTDALAAVLSAVEALPVESATFDDAFRRVLASDLAALRSQPPAAMSAMDGYAVRADDIAAIPASLTVIGEVAAGRPFDGAVGGGQAARIFTGGVVPQGADTVVIQEDTTRDGDTVTVRAATAAGRNIRAAGIDFREGDVLLRKGERLTDRDLSLAASMNHPALPVYRRPRVAFVATGDELVMPGSALAPGQIVYSNGYSLHALARAEGAEVIDLGIVGDTLAATTDAIRRARASRADIMVTTGGASVGDHDVVGRAFVAEGIDLSVWKVALRPGKPMMHGRSGGMRVLGLPGNPVSSYVCAFLFMVPLIRALSGRNDVHHPVEAAVLATDLPENDHRQDYLRARLAPQPDALPLATAVTKQDSSLMAYLASAQALIIRDPFAPAARAGSVCRILKLPL
jgi:molybdopterin molybdotransferase